MSPLDVLLNELGRLAASAPATEQDKKNAALEALDAFCSYLSSPSQVGWKPEIGTAITNLETVCADTGGAA